MVIEQQVPGTSLRSILVKTTLNAGFALTVGIPVMFTSSTLLEPPTADGQRNTLMDAVTKIQANLLPTFFTGVFFWQPVNFVVFKWVAAQNRAVVNSAFGVVWNIYLSGQANKEIVHLGSNATKVANPMELNSTKKYPKAE
jgi:hypothetical protein